MKKQIRRAMMCTIAMMLMGVVSLTGVTYAWFSQSETAVVGGVDLGIVSKEGGVLMSAIPNPEEWKYRLNLEINEIDFNPASMVPENIKEDGSIQFYDGIINESAPSEIYTKAIGQNKYYIQKDLYFYNDSLTDSITVKVDKDATSLSDVSNNVDRAMRMAIVAHRVYTKGTDENGIGAFKNSEPENIKIYEFNPTSHRDGTIDVKTTYGVKAASGEGNYFKVATHEGYIKDGYPDTNPEYLAETVTVYKDSLDDISFEIPADSYYAITVYIWLEGQDVDCVNEISGSSMKIQLGFTKAD